MNKLCILSLFRLVLVRRFKRKINLSPFELTQFLEIIWFSLKFQMFLFKCGILSQALLRYAGMTFIDPYNLHVILKRISRQMHLLVSVNNSFSWSVICSKSSFGHIYKCVCQTVQRPFDSYLMCSNWMSNDVSRINYSTSSINGWFGFSRKLCT